MEVTPATQTADGTAAASNARGGIWCNGDDVTIGGTTTADRNVISGNTQYGITMSDGTGVRIVGNYIGTNAAGSAAVLADMIDGHTPAIDMQGLTLNSRS